MLFPPSVLLWVRHWSLNTAAVALKLVESVSVAFLESYVHKLGSQPGRVLIALPFVTRGTLRKTNMPVLLVILLKYNFNMCNDPTALPLGPQWLLSGCPNARGLQMIPLLRPYAPGVFISGYYGLT